MSTQETTVVAVKTFEEFRELFNKQSIHTVKGYYDAFNAQLFTYLGQDKKKYGDLAKGAAIRASMLAEELKNRGQKYFH